MNYKLEIYLKPMEPRSDYPYFWCIKSIELKDESEWCTEKCGWAKTYEEAFKDATQHVDKYLEV